MLTLALLLLLASAPVATAQTPGFIAGVNYPWHNYGWDFGANAWGHRGVSDPASRAVVGADFADMKAKGVKVARWFVFCDGRAAPEFGPDGKVTGLDGSFFPDLDAALAIAQDNGIRLILVLLDFRIFDPAGLDKGVQTGGRSYLITDPAAQDSFFKMALEPLLRRYGRHPAVLAWEVINEPELRMKAAGVKQDRMHAFAKRTAALVHAETGQLVTLGAWKRRHVKRWLGAGLDFYQFHHYSDGLLESFDRPVADLHLDKPCLLGEFPTRKSKRGLEDYLDTAKRNGLSGALLWSYRAQDDYSDFAGVAGKLAAWIAGKNPTQQEETEEQK